MSDIIQPEIKIAGHEKISLLSYNSITTPTVAALGLRNVELGQKPNQKVIEAGKNLSKFIDATLINGGNKPAISIFWLRNNLDTDTLFLHLPHKQTGNKESALISLQSDPSTRIMLFELLTNKALSQEDLQNRLLEIFQPLGIDFLPDEFDYSALASMDINSASIIKSATENGKVSFTPEKAKSFRQHVQIRKLEQKQDKSTLQANIHSTPVVTSLITKAEPVIQKTLKPEYNQRVIKIETEDESALQDIDLTVRERRIEGKWKGRVTIHGQLFAPPNFNLKPRELKDYMLLPVVKNENGEWKEELDPEKFYNKMDEKGRMFFFDEACKVDMNRREQLTMPEGIDFGKSLNFVYLRDAQETDKTWLMILAPNNQQDESDRKTYFARLFCHLPNEQFRKLISLIEKHPDNAERFVQIAFAGIDDNKERPTARIPVNQISLIDLDQYIPLTVLPEKNKIIGFAYQEMARLNR